MRSVKELDEQRQQIRNRLLLAFQRRALEEGMTQAELSRQTGASSATVNEWIKTGVVPDGVMLGRIAHVLAVNGHWLLTGEGSMQPPVKREKGSGDAFRAGADAVLARLADVIDQLRHDFGADPERAAKALARQEQTIEVVRKHRTRRGPKRQAS